MTIPATAQIIDELTTLEERLTALKHLAHAAHNQLLAQLEDTQRYRMLADPWNDGRPIEDHGDISDEDVANVL